MGEKLSDEAEWFDALKAKGHMPVVAEDGELDIFVYDEGHHNGPGCQACRWSCCWHCTPISEIPECTAISLEVRAALEPRDER